MDRRLIWIDCEMTGSDVATGRLMEIAAVVTTSEWDRPLSIIAKTESIVIHCDDATLNNMSEWCVRHHGSSGLTQSCRESIRNFVYKNRPQKRKAHRALEDIMESIEEYRYYVERTGYCLPSDMINDANGCYDGYSSDDTSCGGEYYE